MTEEKKKKGRSLRDQLKLITDAVRNRKKDYNREMGPYLNKKKNKKKNNR